MKKSRIFMLSGAALLAISAVFATKANKKLFGVGLSSASTGASGFVVQVPNAIFTVTPSLTGVVRAYMAIRTAVNDFSDYYKPVELFTATKGTTPVYLVP